MSTTSKPAFSANVLGITSNASANATIAICSLPDTESAKAFNCFAISISGDPPPITTLPSSIVADTTPSASSNALSTSDETCLVLPLIKILHALGLVHSCMKVNFWSNIFFSKMHPAVPSLSSVKSSSFVTSFAPVALSIRSTSDF